MNYEISINGQLFSSEERYISGKTIRKIGNIPSGHLISFRINKTNRYIELEDDDSVDLGHPETEHFFTRPKEAMIY